MTVHNSVFPFGVAEHVLDSAETVLKPLWLSMSGTALRQFLILCEPQIVSFQSKESTHVGIVLKD